MKRQSIEGMDQKPGWNESTALRTDQGGSPARTRYWLALLLPLFSGCARIYRPITVAPAPVHRAPGDARASVQFQPWGDNSRYGDRAQGAGVQLLVLTVTNDLDHPIRVTLDLEPIQGHWLSPDQAHALIRQSRMGFALYPIGSLALLPPGQTGAWSALANTISAISFGTTLTIALSNAAVANRSNQKLEAFFQQNAWTDGEIPSAGSRQGLVWFRPFRPLRAPSIVRIQIVDGGGSRSVEVPIPEPTQR